MIGTVYLSQEGGSPPVAKTYALDDRSQLHKDANKLLDENLAVGEPVLVILRGTYDSALIATDRRVFVFKKGMMAGAMGGKKFTSYDYRHLTGCSLETGIMSGTFSLQGPGISSEDLSYWSGGKGDPSKAPHALAMNSPHHDQAKRGTAELRHLIADHQATAAQPAAAAPTAIDPADQLRKLAELRDAGILTAEEFEAKKSELLARM